MKAARRSKSEGGRALFYAINTHNKKGILCRTPFSITLFLALFLRHLALTRAAAGHLLNEEEVDSQSDQRHRTVEGSECQTDREEVCLIHTNESSECCEYGNNAQDDSCDRTSLAHTHHCHGRFLFRRFFEHESGEEMDLSVRPENPGTKKDEWTRKRVMGVCCIPLFSCTLVTYEDLPGMAIGFCDVD